MADDNNVSVSFTATTSNLQAGAKQAEEAINSVSKNTVEGMNTATYATAGTTREFIVLGHEVLTGNFARIPGSLMVLAERMGSLHTIVESLKDPWVAAAAAITGAIIAMGAASLHAAESMGQIEISLQSAGNASLFTEDQIKGYTNELSKLAGVSKGEARQGFEELAASAHITQSNFDSLYKLLPDIAAGMKTDIPTAAKEMAQAMQDPARAIEQLIQKTGDLDPATEKLFLQFKQTNDTANEQALLLSLLAERYGGLSGEVVSITKNFWKMWDSIVGVNEELTKGQREELAFGSAFAKPQLEKEGAEAAAAMRANNEKQIAQFKQQENDQVSRGIALEESLNQKKGEQLRIEGQIKQLQQAKAAATNLGDIKDAKDFSRQIGVLEQQMTAESKREEDKRLSDFRQTETEKYQNARELAASDFQMEEETVRMKASLNQISGSQEIQILTEAEQRKFNIEMNTLNQEIALWHKGSAEYQKVQDEINKAVAQHNLERLKIEKQGQDLSEHQWSQYTNVLKSSLDSGLRGMLSGTETWRQAMGNLFQNLLITKFESIVENQVKVWGASEATKTAATTTGNAARTVSNTAASTASIATTFSTYVAAIEADAAKTYASVFAFLSPVMGPFAAAPAGIAAALVGGMAALIPSFDVGTNFVPNDMLAMVHKGERIIPAADNAALMQATGQGGGGGGDLHIHMNGDVYGMRDFQRAVADAVSMGARSFNPNLTRLAR